jgi:hypothetical protein
MRIALLIAFLSILGACAFVNESVGVTGVGACIRENCRDPDARDYTRCEAACRAQYAR